MLEHSLESPGFQTARSNINLASVDLNLLVALEALLDHRNVTHAAQHVGLSQPAMSRALARLRDMFGDDILVRTSNGFAATPRGEQLATKLPKALDSIRALVAIRDGATEEGRCSISVAMPDHQSLVLLPRLLPRIRNRAPHMQIVTHSLFAGALRRVESGEIDYAIGQISNAPSGFFRRTLYVDRFACLVRRGHPVLKQPWTADSFAALRHAVIAPGSEQGFGQVYDALASLELPDRDPLIVPNMLTAPMIVADTDLCLTVPYRVAVHAASMFPLTLVDPPVDLPSYEVSLIWHERNHRDPEHAWIRAEMAAATLTVVQKAEVA